MNGYEEGGINRPKDWMENPYICKGGKDYHTYEALMAANKQYLESLYILK